jgi:hypothetical protein
VAAEADVAGSAVLMMVAELWPSGADFELFVEVEGQMDQAVWPMKIRERDVLEVDYISLQ